MNAVSNTDVSALIFDMDGTMVDSMVWHRQAWLVFAQRHGIKCDVDDLMRRITGRNGPECIFELFQRRLPPGQIEAYTLEKESIYRELFAPEFSEVEGFTRFANEAHARGLKIGVGTAGDQYNMAFVLSRLQLAHPPLASVGGDEGLPGKPEPAIFLEVAHRMGVPPAQCIVFEDAPYGIEAARRAGMRAVGICTGHSADELAGPHVVAHANNFLELLAAQFLEKHHVKNN